MDAIIMPSTTSLAARLSGDFPQFQFAPDKEFRWSPVEKTVFFDQFSDDPASLLHELSHALLGHTDYFKDIQLIGMERDAWSHASDKLCPAYGVRVTDEEIQDALDTYRDWLHARSTCPTCTATGIQAKIHTYRCIACGAKWSVNDARVCALRRYKLSP